MDTVRALIEDVAYLLRDEEMVQWEESDLVRALNEAFAALCAASPGTYTPTRDIMLVAGARQSIPDSANGIYDIVGNLDPASGQLKRAVRLVERSVLDAVNPQWMQDKPRNHIREWMRDADDERFFYVWPPASSPRGDAPVVPDEPVDPGPVQDGFPANVTRYSNSDVRRPTIDSIYLTLNGTPLAVFDFVFLDFTDWTPPASLLLRNVSGGHFQFFANELLAPGVSMTIATINAAIAAGTPFLLVQHSSASGWTVMSPFLASPEDIELIVPPQPAADLPEDAIVTSQYPISLDSDYVDTSEARYNVLEALDEFSYFRIRLQDSNSAATTFGDDRRLIVTNDTGDTVTYRLIITGTPLTIAFGGGFIHGGAANRQSVFFVARQAEPNGAEGVMYWAGSQNAYDSANNLDVLVPELQALIGLDTVTQAEVDAYLAELAEYNAAVAALTAYQALPPSAVLRTLLAEVPCIEDGAVPVCGPEVTVPPLPVDPGTVGDGADDVDIYNSALTTGNGLGQFNLEHRDGAADAEFDVLFADERDIVINLSDFNDTGSLESIDDGLQRVFANGTIDPGAALSKFNLWEVGGSADLRWNDARLVEGNNLLAYWDVSSNTMFIRDFDYDYNPGTTQVEVDAYDAALTAYYDALYAKWLRDAACDGTLPAAPVDDNTDRYDLNLAAYNAAVAAVPTVDTDAITLDSELPVSKVYYPFLREYMLYRAYLSDDEESSTYQRAGQHRKQAYESAGFREASKERVRTVRESNP